MPHIYQTPIGWKLPTLDNLIMKNNCHPLINGD